MNHHIYYSKTQNTNNHDQINTVNSEGCQRTKRKDRNVEKRGYE